MSEQFILTNEQRQYLGLKPIEDHYEILDIKGTFYYFDGNRIVKEIMTSGYDEDTFFYRECELDVETAENKTIVLPKTARGKPKKLNFTATQSFRENGVYFEMTGQRVIIGNYTTQKTFYTKRLTHGNPPTLFQSWLNEWIKETTQDDLNQLEIFKNEKRVHQKYKEGDIFTFKINRRQYGFGKILIDVTKRRKTKEFKDNKNYGLANLMGTALIVKVYHYISDTTYVNLDELEACLSLPSQSIMDNRIYYGEYQIIGNRKVTYHDLDETIVSTSRSINYLDRDIAYLQYGLIYREMPLSEYETYDNKDWYHENYRDEAIGFSLDIEELEDCIKAHSNEPYYRRYNKGKLHNPIHHKDKVAIFKAFGLDANLDYESNLKRHERNLESNV